MYPFFLFIGIMAIIFISNYYTLVNGEQHYSDQDCELYDLFHKILPDLHNYHYMIDLISLTAIISLFFLANETFITEFLTKFILIMFIRAFTIFVTILPKNDVCKHSFGWREYFLGGCYDKIFSGHTSFILLLTLLYFREHIIDLVPLLGINLINIFMILATRSHYTVDVLLAVFVTTTIYSLKI